MYKYLCILLLASSCAAQTLPTSVKVNTMTGDKLVYTIHWTKDKVYRDSAKKCEILAYTDCVSHQIVIHITKYNGVPLMHETLHAITECTDENHITHDFIYRVAPRIQQMIHDNPGVAAVLNSSTPGETKSDLTERYSKVSDCAK